MQNKFWYGSLFPIIYIYTVWFQLSIESMPHLVCDNLTRYKWDQDTTIGTDWTLTGIVLEAPVNAFVKLDAVHFWAASAPRGLRITRSNTSASTDVVASVEDETDHSQLTTSAFGIKNYGVNTYYVWAKAKAAGKNYIALAYGILLEA